MSWTDWGIPDTFEKWGNVLMLIVGGLCGWLTHPLVWVCFGPVRWCCFLVATAAQESGFNASAVGDLDSPYGTSVGMLQFNQANVGVFISDQGRYSAFQSGYAAAGYVQAALLTDVRWFMLGIPLFGLAVGRHLWGGFGRSDSILAGAWASLADDARTLRSFLTWRVLTFPVAAFGGFLVVRGVAAWGRGRR